MITRHSVTNKDTTKHNDVGSPPGNDALRSARRNTIVQGVRDILGKVTRLRLKRAMSLATTNDDNNETSERALLDNLDNDEEDDGVEDVLEGEGEALTQYQRDREERSRQRPPGANYGRNPQAVPQRGLSAQTTASSRADLYSAHSTASETSTQQTYERPQTATSRGWAGTGGGAGGLSEEGFLEDEEEEAEIEQERTLNVLGALHGGGGDAGDGKSWSAAYAGAEFAEDFEGAMARATGRFSSPSKSKKSKKKDSRRLYKPKKKDTSGGSDSLLGRKPLSAGGSGATGGGKTVVLGGVPMPLVDPKVFQEFWAERQKARSGEGSFAADSHVLRVEKIKGKNTSARRPWSAVEKGKRGGVVVAGGSAANLRALRAQKKTSGSSSASNLRSGKRSKGPRPVSAQPRLPTAAGGGRSRRRRGDVHEHETTRNVGSGTPSHTPVTRGTGRAAKRAASTSALSQPRPGSKLSSSESEKLFKLKYGGGGMEEQKTTTIRKKKYTTSREYLHRAAKRAREADERFQKVLEEEERQFQRSCMSRITEANTWCSQLGIGREYSLRMLKGGAMNVMVKEKVPVMDTTSSSSSSSASALAASAFGRRTSVATTGDTRTITVEMFLREHDKLRVDIEKRSERGNGGKKVATKAARTTAKARRAIKAELRTVLQETRQLTQVLEEQLETLRVLGWNKR